MKKLIATLFSLLIYANTSFAATTIEIPDEFTVTEHWVSLTSSFDIATKTKKLGTLYRKFFSLLLTYEFFDPYDNKLASATARFFSLSAHFDVYDNHNALLGSAVEQIFTFFPTFDVYASDGSTKLARAEMNFWGTIFYIYEAHTNRQMAVMSRSFFRLKNDWTIKVTNRALFSHSSMDPRLLMTVIAFQGDRENWERDRRDDTDYDSYQFSLKAKANPAETTAPQVNSLLKKIAVSTKKAGLEGVQKPDPTTLESIAKELENNYKSTQSNDDSSLTTQERMNSFTDYCLSLVESKDVSNEKKKAILFLLKLRLDGAVV